MNTLIEQFLHYLVAERNFSPRTGKAYQHDLSKFVAYLNTVGIKEPSQITENDVSNFISFLSQRNAAITQRRKLSSIKSFFKYLIRRKILTSNPASEVERIKIPEKEPCYLTQDEYQALLAAVKRVATPYYQQRDLAIVTLLLGTGIRLSELTGLNVHNIKLNNGESTIKVKGKGDRERTIPLNDEVVHSLEKYVKTRPEVETERLFVSRKGNGLSAGAVYNLVKRYLKATGIIKDKVGVHSLRHTFATSLLNNKGINLVQIQQLMGHKNLETTRRYLHVSDLDLRNAVNSLVLSKKQ